MTLRMANIRFGIGVLIVTAVFGGLGLGRTFDQYSVKDGYHVMDLSRFYLREGHSHGNFMDFLNLFVGIIINNLNLTDKLKSVGFYAAMIAIFLPIGLAMKGASPDFDIPAV